MIEVLQYIPAFNYGGIESFMLDVNKSLKDEFHFTYLVERDIEEELQDKIKSVGADVIRIPNLTREGALKHIKAIKKVIKDGNFDILHVHGCGLRFFAMFYAKKYKIQKRIYHVHSSRIEGKELLNKIGIKLNILFSNYLIACSSLSAKKMLGNKSNKAIIIESKVNLSKYIFDKNGRNIIRQQYKIKNDETLVGTVGRLVNVKNQEYLLDVFNEYLKIDDKGKLIFVGDGYLQSELEEKAKKMKIDRKVIFAGKQSNTSYYYSAMDIFCLPSYSEGYPVSLIEAQANGLKCIVSSAVTNEVDATGEILFLNINKENINEWVEGINSNKKKRYNKIEELYTSGFDIQDSINKIYKIYTDNKGIK